METKSKEEEMLGIVKFILAVLCYQNDYTIIGHIFLVLGTLDILSSIVSAIKFQLDKRK